MIINNDVLIGLIRKTVDGGLSLRLNVRGFSMAPFIKDRDMVTIKKFGGRAHIWGTPAVYIHRCGKLVVHRVVGMRGKYYMLKADNSLAPDGYIPQEDLLGRVVRIERGNVDVSFCLGSSRFPLAIMSRFNVLPRMLRLYRLLRSAAWKYKRRISLVSIKYYTT